MTVVNITDFATNQEKYLDMALNEQVFIQRGDYMFHILCSNFDAVNTQEQAILEPDEDLRRAIPLEEVRDRVIDYIHRKHAKAV